MTEPTYEINYEKLSSLSIADLTGLWNYCDQNIILLEKICTKESLIQINTYWRPFLKACSSELDYRINDIIIF